MDSEKHESEEILNEGNQYTALRIKKWTIFQLAVRGDWGLDNGHISNYLFISRSFWEARHMLLSEYAIYAVHISHNHPSHIWSVVNQGGLWQLTVA